MDTPPVPWMRTVESGLEIACREGVPGGDCGARQGGGLFEAEAIGDGDQPRLLEHDIFGQHPVDVSTESAFDLGWRWAGRRASSA